jgi:prevent-host-death family protein
MAREIPVTEARAEFAELINRVGYGGERVIITRHGKPLVALVPADEAGLGEAPAEDSVVVLDVGSAALGSSPPSLRQAAAEHTSGPRAAK